MRTKVKAFIVVVGVLLVVTAISLIIFSRGPIYGQEGEDNWIPDLRGVWIGEAAGYGIDDMTDPDCEPVYAEGPFGDEGDIIITHQTGSVFAGTYEESDGKLTGVILKDRTVSIQFFELSETRFFFTGRMTKSGDTLQISGYVHMFDDFQHYHFPYEERDKEMASGYVRLIKVD